MADNLDSIINDAVGGNDDLVDIPGGELRRSSAAAWNKMVADARAQGVLLSPGSSYRSRERQAQLYAKAQKKYGSGASHWVAPPGRSTHQQGNTVDVRGPEGTVRAGSKAHQWLVANAGKYGFSQPMSWEPWHWRHGDRTAPIESRSLGRDGATSTRQGVQRDDLDSIINQAVGGNDDLDSIISAAVKTPPQSPQDARSGVPGAPPTPNTPQQKEAAKLLSRYDAVNRKIDSLQKEIDSTKGAVFGATLGGASLPKANQLRKLKEERDAIKGQIPAKSISVSAGVTESAIGAMHSTPPTGKGGVLRPPTEEEIEAYKGETRQMNLRGQAGFVAETKGKSVADIVWDKAFPKASEPEKLAIQIGNFVGELTVGTANKLVTEGPGSAWKHIVEMTDPSQAIKQDPFEPGLALHERALVLLGMVGAAGGFADPSMNIKANEAHVLGSLTRGKKFLTDYFAKSGIKDAPKVVESLVEPAIQNLVREEQVISSKPPAKPTVESKGAPSSTEPRPTSRDTTSKVSQEGGATPPASTKDFEGASIKNEETTRMVKDFELGTATHVPDPFDLDKAVSRAKQERVPERAHQIATDITEGRKSRLDDYESAGMAMRLSDLKESLTSLKEKLKYAPGDEGLLKQYADQLDEADTIVRASEQAGSEWHKEGMARQKFFKGDYSEVGLRAKHYKETGKMPDAEQAKKYADLGAENERLQAEVEKLREQTERVRAAHAEDAVTKAASDAIRVVRGGKLRSRDQIRVARDAAKARLKKNLTDVSLSSGPEKLFNPEIYADLYEIAKGHIEEGVITLGELIKKTQAEVDSVLPKGHPVDTDQIRYAVSGMWEKAKYKPRPTRTEVYYRQLAKITEQIHDALAGKYKRGQKQNLDVIKRAREELNRVLKEQGELPPDDPVHNLEKILAGLEDRAKVAPEDRVAQKQPKQGDSSLIHEQRMKEQVAQIREDLAHEERMTLAETNRGGESAKMAEIRKQRQESIAYRNALIELEDALKGATKPETPKAGVSAKLKNIREQINRVRGEMGTGKPADPVEAKMRSLSEQLAKLQADFDNGVRYLDNPKARNQAIADLQKKATEAKRAVYGPGRQARRMSDLIKKYEEEARTGVRKETPKPVIHMEDALYKKKMELAEAKGKADEAIYDALHNNWASKAGGIGIAFKMVKIVSALKDVVSHGAMAVENAVLRPVQTIVMKGMRKGAMLEGKYTLADRPFFLNYRRILKDAPARWKAEFAHRGAKISEMKFGSHNKAINLRVSTDIVPLDLYYHGYLSDMADVIAKQTGKDAEAIYRQLSGKSEADIIPWKDVEEIRQNATHLADRQTLNSPNVFSRGKAAAMNRWRADMVKTLGKERGTIAADAADAVANQVFFAAKVILNVAEKGAELNPGWAAGRVLQKLAVNGRRLLTADQALQISTVASRGLAGVGIGMLAKALYHNGVYTPQITVTDKGKKFVQSGFWDEVSPAVRYFHYEAAMEAVRSSAMDDHAKKRLMTQITGEFILSNTLTTDAKLVGRVMSGEITLEQAIAQIGAAQVIPGQIQEASYMLDDANSRQAVTWWDEVLKKSLFWRDTLPPRYYTKEPMYPGWGTSQKQSPPGTAIPKPPKVKLPKA